MAIRIQKRKHKNGRTWRLVIVVERTKDANGKRKRDFVYPKPTEYAEYGFNPAWTIEEAIAERKRQQALGKSQRLAQKRAAIKQRLEQQDLSLQAFFPDDVHTEFLNMLKGQMGLDPDEDFPSKNASYWRAAQKLIVEMQIPPTDYFEQSARFYSLVRQKRMSPSYVQKVLRLVNLYGYFMCKRAKQAFMPIPSARGRQAERIIEAYEQKRPDGLDSAPLTPEMLEKARPLLREYVSDDLYTEKRYRWITVTLMFGLRPSEADRLRPEDKGKYWNIEVDHLGTEILWIYQTKLKSVKKEKRWKKIAVLYPDQTEALAWIKEGKELKRPLVKTMKRVFSERHTTYAGRKSFMDLLMSRGWKFENASLAMGHRSLDRSLRNYVDASKTYYDLPVTSDQLKKVD